MFIGSFLFPLSVQYFRYIIADFFCSVKGKSKEKTLLRKMQQGIYPLSITGKAYLLCKDHVIDIPVYAGARIHFLTS
jgi:hypothetical protein